jgi:hypothetical protein
MPPAKDAEKPENTPKANASSTPAAFGGAWSDRLRALKNVPAVLRIVWESGPSVVFSNITLRILVAFLPVGIGIIGRFIIDGVNRIRLHQPLPQGFWWLVAAEMTLAVLTGVLSRAVDCRERSTTSTTCSPIGTPIT